MTIRDHLLRRVYLARAVALVCWLVLMSGIILGDRQLPMIILCIPFAGFGGAVLYALFFIKCPNCGARLGPIMNSWGRTNYCPGCGVGLDEEL
jgi:hypothetical protein